MSFTSGFVFNMPFPKLVFRMISVLVVYMITLLESKTNPPKRVLVYSNLRDQCNLYEVNFLFGGKLVFTGFSLQNQFCR